MSYMDKEEIVRKMTTYEKDNFVDAPTELEKRNRERLIEPNAFFDGEIIGSERRKAKSESLFYSKNEKSLLDQIDLRQYDCPVEAQDNGKCTAWALSHSIINMLHQQDLGPIDLSEWHMWSFYRQYSCATAIKTIKRKFVADEKYWPQYESPKEGIDENAHATIQSYRFIDNDVHKMMQALNRGHVVYLGMTTPRDMVQGKAVIHPDSAMTNGGHALSIVGYYRDKRVPGEVVAIVKNSWGKETGDKGYQYLPIAHMTHRADMYIIMWEIEEVASKRKGHVDKPKYECEEWKRIWWMPWKYRCVRWGLA